MIYPARFNLFTRLIVAAALLAGVAAHAIVAPSLSVSSIRGFTDRDAELALALSRATNTTAFQFDLSFNPLSVDRLPPVWSELLSNHVVRTHELKPGLWRMLIYSPSNALLAPNIQIAHLPFHIPATERNGSGPITPSSFILAHPDATAIQPVSTRAGRIFISQVSPPDPDGSVGIFFPVTQSGEYVLFASDDFSAWTPVSTNSASGNIVDFIDPDAAKHPHRFYFMRDAVIPNPPGLFPGPQLTSVGGSRQLQIAVPSAGLYQLEASADLKTWLPVGPATNASGTLAVPIQQIPSTPQRLFRVRPTTPERP